MCKESVASRLTSKYFPMDPFLVLTASVLKINIHRQKDITMEKRKLFHILANIHNIPSEEIEVIHLEPGSRLGINDRYEIIDLLGTGSIGAAYLAKDYEQQQNLLSLKIILPCVFLNSVERRLQLFKKYLNVVREIEHANVIQIKDFYHEENLYFYTMEYIPGCSLRELIQSSREQGKKISPSNACEMLLQICRGLSAVHQHSGHYRLHLDNIIITDAAKPTVKICDFGTYYAQPHNFWKKAAIALGQDNYQAPEYDKKLTRLTIQSDIFSLGIILMDMLSCSPPSSKDSLAYLTQQCQDIPLELKQIIQTAIQPDSTKRHANVSEFMEELRRAMAKSGRELQPSQEKPAEIPISLSKSNGKESIVDIPPSRETEEPIPIEAEEEISKTPPTHDEISQKTTEKKHSGYTSRKLRLSKSGKVDTIYDDYLEKIKKLAQEKRWDRVIDCCNQALELQPVPEIEEFLEQAANVVQRAKELKHLALQMRDEVYPCADLIKQSMDLCPYDIELQELFRDVDLEINSRKMSVDETLSKGDMLVGTDRYEEALQIWKEALGVSSREKDKEISDRMMQVVDMLGETTRQYLDEGRPYEAKNILEKIIKYTDDALIIDMYEEVMHEVQERESHFQQAWKEGKKHFDKRQFSAAVEVWKNVIGLTGHDQQLLELIEKAKTMEKQLHQDEEEYHRLTSLARALEQREDYENALQTWERIHQQNSQWMCPTQDVTDEIERLTKLVAAMNVSAEAKKILLEITNAIDKHKLDRATALLANPIFRRKLLPSVETKYHNISEQVQNNILRRKYIQRISWIVLAILGVGGVILLSMLH